MRAGSSEVEQMPHKHLVAGSIPARPTIAERLFDMWREEVEYPKDMYRTFGSSRNCSNCYFSNKYITWFVCRRNMVGIPGLLHEFKCSKWIKE